MPALGLEISTRCKSCGNVVAVNAFVPVVVCGACDRRLSLDDTRWHLLLDDPAREGPAMPSMTERSGPLTTEDGLFQRVYRRQDVSCTGCGSPLPSDRLRAMAPRGSGFCPSCAAPVVVRAAPPPLAAMGVAALVGEDRVQLAGPDAPSAGEAVPIACATCGGGLRVDGTQRLVHCPFCRGSQYLPDDLWRRLHPSRPVVRWSLVFAPGAVVAAGANAAAAAASACRWDDLADVVVDGFGNLYCAGSYPNAEDWAEFAVWCMTPDLKLRWLRSGLKFDDSDARLALAPSGHVLCWQKDKKSVLILQCSDGATAARLSGKPNEGRALEMDDCENLVADADGTVLMEASGHRLLRYTPFGDPIATWGTGAREPRPAEDEDAHVVTRMGRRPLFSMSAKIGVGWDGFVYFHQIYDTEDRIVVARYDRSGSQLYKTGIKTRESTWAMGRPCADARGVCHVLVRTDSGAHELWRIRPDGRGGDSFLVSRERGGLIGKEEKLAVLPDGTVWMLGDGAQARRFGPDGRVQYITEASRKADQERIEEEEDDD